jgi:hypothetical protein
MAMLKLGNEVIARNGYSQNIASESRTVARSQENRCWNGSN